MFSTLNMCMFPTLNLCMYQIIHLSMISPSADKELQLLQQGQARQLAEVQATTQENETMLRDQVGPLEEGLLTITSKFRQLHEHMNFVVRGAASFGDRLQVGGGKEGDGGGRLGVGHTNTHCHSSTHHTHTLTQFPTSHTHICMYVNTQTKKQTTTNTQMADKIQSGALEALQVVEYMQAFSMADTSTPLPDIFTNPTHLRKAAAMSRNLLQVGHELVVSSEGGGGRGGGRKGDSGVEKVCGGVGGWADTT